MTPTLNNSIIIYNISLYKNIFDKCKLDDDMKSGIWTENIVTGCYCFVTIF